MIRLVILDRDGVLNKDRVDSVKSLSEMEIFPQTAPAIARLTAAGLPVALATNQSVIGRRIITPQQLDQIHQLLQQTICAAGGKIDHIYVATDFENAADPAVLRTQLRKPGGGMLIQAMTDFGVTTAQTIFVGDSLIDLQAAANAGCKAILVKTGKGQSVIDQGIPKQYQPTGICNDIDDAVTYILEHLR